MPRSRGDEMDSFGVPLESVLARRERLADNYDIEFGQERVFPALVEAVLDEVPPGSNVLEVGAATGLMTRPLLQRAGMLTALEPSLGMLHRLVSSEVAASPQLRTLQGMVEDLSPGVAYDIAVVTFTPRRGRGLLKLLLELAVRVRESVVMMLDERPFDWAYLARSAASYGFNLRLRLVQGPEGKRAVVLTAGVEDWEPVAAIGDDWVSDAREVLVPYPAPRGAATRLIRFMQAGGDRALLVQTQPEGVDRLYGNLRTAVHRLGRHELAVRRDGDAVTIVRLPKHVESAGD